MWNAGGGDYDAVTVTFSGTTEQELLSLLTIIIDDITKCVNIRHVLLKDRNVNRKKLLPKLPTDLNRIVLLLFFPDVFLKEASLFSQCEVT